MIANDAAAVAAYAVNNQSVSDFWLFVVYCLVVIVVVLFFLFYFNRVLGQILTWIINQYTWRHYNAYIEVDSIRFTILGARILFKNFRYFSTNQSITIVKGHISIQYWLMNVRKADTECTEKHSEKKNKLPCRIVCSIQGLEWFMYNNIPAYESMKGVLDASELPNDRSPSPSPTSSSTSSLQREGTLDPENVARVGVEASLIRRLMPIQFECTTGAMMIGNNELRSMIVVEAAQVNGIWSAENSRTTMDQYQSVIDLVLRKPQISLKENMDYAVDSSPTPNAERSSYFTRFWTWFSYPFKLFYPASRTRQFGHMQHMHDLMRNRDPERSSAQSTEFREEYARVKNVLECSKMAIVYYADVPGPVPHPANAGSGGIGVDIGNGGLPPEWGVKILIWNAVFHYGPWTDRQRNELQDFFFPNAHRNNKVTPRLKPGQPRQSTELKFHIETMTEATLRIPTREKSKDWKYESGSADLDLGPDGYYARPFGWIDIKTGIGSIVKTVTPFAYGEDGSTSTIKVQLKDVDVSTSVNYASLLSAKELELSVAMNSPLQWNAHRIWTIDSTIKCPRIFLLRDHVFLFQDLIKDWTSTPPPELLYFIPVTYEFKINVTDPTLFLCVNEHNIISNPNAVEDNAFIKIQASKINYIMSLPFIYYEPESNVIHFTAEIEQFIIGISLQTSHTLNAFLSQDNAQFGKGVHASIKGSYEYYTSVDVVHHIESMNLQIRLDSVTCTLFGTVIRYIMILRDNYVGSWVNFSTIEEYRQRRANPEAWQETKKKQADAKPIQDPFEVYILVDVQDGSLILPENLYNIYHCSQLEFQELQVELRNLDIYMDMYINVSPITWTRNCYPNTNSALGPIRMKNARDSKNFLYIDELNIYAHRLFGPLPEVDTYLCHWEFEVGRITGEVKPSFLLGTACFAQTFAYNMIDEDNAVPAEIAPAADPDVTFVKASIREVDIFLMSHHSATEIRLKDGLSFGFDNLINQKYNQRFGIRIPEIVATSLADQEQYKTGVSTDNGYSWVEVAKMSVGMDITVFRHTTDWQTLRNAQQNYIRTQDYASRRCPHLYEEDAGSHDASSQASSSSTNGYHVGVLYAPAYRLYNPFTMEHTKSKEREYNGSLLDSSQTSITERNHRQPSINDTRSVSSSYLVDWGNPEMSSRSSHDDELGQYFEHRSLRSARSNDTESFHTADSGDFSQSMATDTYAAFYYNDDRYSQDSDQGTDTEESLSSADVPAEQIRNSGVPEAAIPSSIPYSEYLNRYSIRQASSVSNRGHTFFHPYLPTPKTQFIPLQPQNECFVEPRRETTFLFPETPNVPDHGPNVFEHVEKENDAAGNEVMVTTVLDATAPLTVLMTPILVKIVQELTEAINKDDWDLETMLDSLQMEYVSQLTRYLTDQFVCTRFAVSLPQTRCHFIQNVTIPEDLPSYKEGYSDVKTKYDLNDRLLCTADVYLDNFCMIGSVRFQDMAYDEKKKSVAMSKMELRESRVHIDLGKLGCKVQYVSDEIPRQPMVFGIPREYQNKHQVQMSKRGADEFLQASELVVLDMMLDGFSFKWLGAQQPNYLSLDINKLSTIIITESVEIVIGAVYSWLVFVDDLKGILESFQDRRSRQIQVFIHKLSNISASGKISSDPLFLTKPTNVLRLGSRNFRNDVGWKLLARMRHCLRSSESSSRGQLQYQLSSGTTLKEVESTTMFAEAVKNFSTWRDWEIRKEDIVRCRLFTQPFKQHSPDENQAKSASDLVDLLVKSINLARIKVESFDFRIYEEEQEMREDNSISMDHVEISLDSEYKRFEIGFRGASDESPVAEPDPRRAATEGYLDVITKLVVGRIIVEINPIILSFARHMLTVQRVFTARLKSLSHTAKAMSTPTTPSDPDSDFINTLFTRVDIVAQALVTLKEIRIQARAQELTMQSDLQDIHGSAIFSNPTLAPLPLFQQGDKADSDTGSGVRSSNKTSKRSPGSRVILEASGGIPFIDVRFYETINRHNHRSLLTITSKDANVNANISQPSRTGRKQGKVESNTRNVLNVFSNIHQFHVHAPESLLRLYSFVEDWRSEQGQRYQFLFQNLLHEWEEQHKDTASPVTSRPKGKKYDIKLQFLLNQFTTLFDLLPSLSVEYAVSDFFITVNELLAKAMPVQQYEVQFSKQEIRLLTKNAQRQSSSHRIGDDYSGGTFNVPSIRSMGRVTRDEKRMRLQSVIFVDFISLTLNVGMIDSLLTAQSLLGNEISELIEVLSYSKEKSKVTPSSSTLDSASIEFKYCIDVRLNGLRVSAEAPSVMGVFESNGLEALISNEHSDEYEAERLIWKLRGCNFALSLEHGTQLSLNNESDGAGLQKRNRLAYIVADFHAQNSNLDGHQPHTSQDKYLEPFYLKITRLQVVTQPIALGKLADTYIYYESELTKRKEMKKVELDRLASNTKRLVDTFKRGVPEQPLNNRSLWEGKHISIGIERLGIAIPLDASDVFSAPKETSALLFSMKSISFVTEDMKKSVATLNDISLQFVRKFDQNNEEHFLATKHSRMNQMFLPSIDCHVYFVSDKPRHTMKIDAKVEGFEVDIDGAFAEYLNVLSVIYVKSMDRVDAFTNLNRNNSSSVLPEKVQEENSELVYLDIEGRFEYKSGVMRMYPKRHSGDANRRKTVRAKAADWTRLSETANKMAVIKIPGLTAWAVYQTPLGALSAVSDSPRRFHGEIAIHESENTLHPSLMQFLQEVIAGIKFGMQQSSERKAVRSSSPSMSQDSNINASVVIRLASTKLDLSCQPTSKVVCSFSWDDGEFLMNAFSSQTASRTMSCVGSIRNISAVVKHHFSPEACLTAQVDQILLNAMLSTTRQGERNEDDISIVVSVPTIIGDVNIRHLQDLLALRAIWIDQATSDNPQTEDTKKPQPTTGGADNVLLGEDVSMTVSPKPFASYIAFHTQTIQLSVDLGQAIGRIMLAPQNLHIYAQKVPNISKGFGFSIDTIQVSSEGRLSGNLQVGRIIVDAYSGTQKPKGDYGNSENAVAKTPYILLLMDGTQAKFEYEYQNILDLILGPVQFSSKLDMTTDSHPELNVNIIVKPLFARLSIKTVPVIVSMHHRLAELVEKKKAEAGILDLIQPEAPPAAEPSTLSLSAGKSDGRTIDSRVDISVHSIEIIIYPSQFQDPDNVELFIQQLDALLVQRVHTDTGAIGRTLTMKVDNAALLRNVNGASLMRAHKPKDTSKSTFRLSGALPATSTSAEQTSSTAPPPVEPTKQSQRGITIFGIPPTRIQMISTQLERQVKHTFSAAFDGRVGVSLNLGSIRYIQELATSFTTQLERANQRDRTRHTMAEPALATSVASPLAATDASDQLQQKVTVSLAVRESEADRDSFDSGVSVNQSSSREPSRKPSTRSLALTAATTSNPADNGEADQSTDTKSAAAAAGATTTTTVATTTAAAASTEKKETTTITYTSDARVDFNPQLQIMGDATPPVEWLGFKRERLPAMVHEMITLHLDQIVRMLVETYEKNSQE